jgi:hypothetical protein
MLCIIDSYFRQTVEAQAKQLKSKKWHIFVNSGIKVLSVCILFLFLASVMQPQWLGDVDAP